MGYVREGGKSSDRYIGEGDDQRKSLVSNDLRLAGFTKLHEFFRATHALFMRRCSPMRAAPILAFAS